MFIRHIAVRRFDEDGSWEDSYCDEWDDDVENISIKNPSLPTQRSDELSMRQIPW
ncbi:MAG: hypothetical protein R2794_09055 [Chitinophagales bacterium]